MKPLAFAVKLFDESQELGHQVRLGGEDATGDYFRLHQAKEKLYQVEPGGIGRNKMEGDLRMGLRPALYHLRFMTADVVQYHVNSFLPVVLDHPIKEPQEVFRAMSILTLGLHLGASHIQSGEQLCGPVSLVVMSTPGYLVGPHRQHGLGSVQCLNLSLLVYAQDRRVLWGIGIEANNVYQLLSKLRVVRAGEGPSPGAARNR